MSNYRNQLAVKYNTQAFGGLITKEESNKLYAEEVKLLPYVYYAHGSYAYYDECEDTYYNDFGQVLRDPVEYDEYSEGYTPFGDE